MIFLIRKTPEVCLTTLIRSPHSRRRRAWSLAHWIWWIQPMQRTGRPRPGMDGCMDGCMDVWVGVRHPSIQTHATIHPFKTYSIHPSKNINPYIHVWMNPPLGPQEKSGRGATVLRVSFKPTTRSCERRVTPNPTRGGGGWGLLERLDWTRRTRPATSPARLGGREKEWSD